MNIDIQDTKSPSKTSVKLIIISGMADSESAKIFESKISEVINSSPKTPIIFDFSACTYINSAVIGNLSNFYNKISNNEGKMFIVTTNKEILDVLQMVGISNIITIKDTVQESLNEIG